MKTGDVFKIDLKDIKYNKLLGSGKVTYKYEIVVKYASEKAIEKIEALGGKVILASAEAESKEEAKPKAEAKPEAKVSSQKEKEVETPNSKEE